MTRPGTLLGTPLYASPEQIAGAFAAALAGATGGAATVTATGDRSIAVIPFDNLSPDAGDSYLADDTPRTARVTDIETYELYLRARYPSGQSVMRMPEALECLEQAIDPELGVGWIPSASSDRWSTARSRSSPASTTRRWRRSTAYSHGSLEVSVTVQEWGHQVPVRADARSS